MRGTGKTTLLKEIFKNDNVLWIDLLLPEQEYKYRTNPSILKNEIMGLVKEGKTPELVIIDEVQKIPLILDLVHYLIEELKIKFILTASSARKLKRGGANLLAGRAFVFEIFPLSYLELKEDFVLNDYLSWGGFLFYFQMSLRM